MIRFLGIYSDVVHPYGQSANESAKRDPQIEITGNRMEKGQTMPRMVAVVQAIILFYLNY